MNSAISFCGLFLLITLSVCVSGGHHGIVDDEIWSHVFKVLSDTEHGKKVLVSHPEPAHLVDAYTKVYHHEPFGYHDGPYHPHHHVHPAPLVYHGHGHVGPHHVHPHPHPVPLYHHHHHGPPPPPLPIHHHHPIPEPVAFRIPVPSVLSSYGPPHLHGPLRHHHLHHKK